MHADPAPTGAQLRFSRRRLLGWITAIGTSGALGSLLAACGGAAATPTTAPSAGGTATAAGAGQTPVTINQNITPTPAGGAGASPAAGGASPAASPVRSPAATTAAAPAGAAGGTFTFSRASDSDNLDPVTQDGNVDIWIFMSIYDQLIKVSDDGLSLQPMLAEKWEVSPDGLTYTFHLRKGVSFSDGTPLKASDV